MKRRFINFTLLFIICTVTAEFYSCNNDPTQEESDTGKGAIDTSINYNIIILLDLSDRVLVENQVARDKAIIMYLFDVFNSIAGSESKMFYDSKDKIRIKILEQQGIPYAGKIPAWEDTMCVDMQRTTFTEKSFDNRGKTKLAFTNTVNEVYSNCIWLCCMKTT
jgi:hypothetical protein